MNDKLADMRSGCPCTVEGIEPCSSSCSCANPVMSGGCERCATYGSLEQRQRAARHIIAALRRSQPEGEMVRHRVIQAAYRPRPICRDCADRDGTCYDGTKCDPFEAALDLLRVAAEAEGVSREFNAIKKLANLDRGVHAGLDKENERLERELALAQSRLAEVEKDAARYRWLKEIGIYIWGDTMTEFGDDELDAAIDAEIKRSSASST